MAWVSGHKDIWLYAISVIEASQIQYKNTLEYIGKNVLGVQWINELLPNNRFHFLLGYSSDFTVPSDYSCQRLLKFEVGTLNQICFWFWWVSLISLRAKISNFPSILVCRQGFKQNLRIRWNFNTQIWFFDTVNDYGFQLV